MDVQWMHKLSQTYRTVQVEMLFCLVIFLIVIPQQSVSRNASYASCPRFVNSKLNCEECQYSTNIQQEDSPVSSQIQSYIKNQQLRFVNNVFNIQWKYGRFVTEARHIYVNAYEQINAGVLKPIPGCCGIPLANKSCRVTYSRSNKIVFVSLTLFRSRTFTEVPKRFNRIANDLTIPWLEHLKRIETKKHSHVCLFQMNKDIVMNISKAPSPYDVDGKLFRRGVFHMPGYYYKEDKLFYINDPYTSVNCTTRSFNNDSNAVFQLNTTSSDNSTFTCLVLWLTVNSSDEAEVKCMPHNATYISSANQTLSTTNRKDKNKILITAFSVAGISVLFALIALVAYKCTLQLTKVQRDIKKVPATLDVVMNTNSDSLKDIMFQSNTEEIAIALDDHEREQLKHYTVQDHIKGQTNDKKEKQGVVPTAVGFLNSSTSAGGDRSQECASISSYLLKEKNLPIHDTCVDFSHVMLVRSRANLKQHGTRTRDSATSQDSGVDSGGTYFVDSGGTYFEYPAMRQLGDLEDPVPSSVFAPSCTDSGLSASPISLSDQDSPCGCHGPFKSQIMPTETHMLATNTLPEAESNGCRVVKEKHLASFSSSQTNAGAHSTETASKQATDSIAVVLEKSKKQRDNAKENASRTNSINRCAATPNNEVASTQNCDKSVTSPYLDKHTFQPVQTCYLTSSA